MVVHDVEQVGFISGWIRQLQTEDAPPNPLLEWGRLVISEVRAAFGDFIPDVIVSSLFCMGLADLLAQELNCRWCFVNPSFYFGAGQRRTWAEDWYGPVVPQLARDVFLPLVGRADMVLHATDPLFDFEPKTLPAEHYYVGFLLSESSDQVPVTLAEPGDPWVLVTASTARPGDEEAMIRSAVSALTGRPVRPILTLPKHSTDLQLPANVVATGFVPHTPILQRSVLSINQAGHGIVSKCLRYGVPMVLTPWDADQPGVAARAEALGVARVVPRSEVTPESISEAVDEVLDGDQYRTRSAAVAEVLAERSPERRASALIEVL
ncbi:MAG TPA: nucleotide disphospho-sugar-binding domain-containing protein [Acidimicrobiia bacterium]|nr:nucleotide disphospho-sugar-binding domain-containing protein [Acidimicrobiia bacterium]